MSLIANIKGFVGGGERGVVIPSPSLWSYQEITSAGYIDAQTELNTRPTEYYEKLNSEGHLYSNEAAGGHVIDNVWYYMGSQWLLYYSWSTHTWQQETYPLPPD